MKRLLKNDRPKFVRHRRAMMRAWALAPLLILWGTVTAAASLPPEQNDYNASGAEIGGQPASDFDYAANDLRTEVWVDRKSDEIYSKGEALKIGFEVNQDAYAVVYRIDTEGQVMVLWPRSRFDDGFVFGSHEYQLPVEGGRKLYVSSQEGQGIVEAIVSKYPFDLRLLELDFYHEESPEQHNFFVAGDPFLAMNEVNYAITGLEDSGEYVVTNYASYYVHQAVDHPRYLCSQCHLDDKVAYDPYGDECTLTIEYDYSWNNSWYDQYGYYPVYGNPVYVYIDPWSYNPWVNYWYSPSYYSAPWYGWGWGWGVSYNWGYSPYYWGDSHYAYSSGYERYRPLDRNNPGGSGGSRTKTREYSRGSEMVKSSGVNERDRSSMVSRTRGNETNASRGTGTNEARADRGRYRGSDLASRDRQSFDQIANGGSSRGGLRIREGGSSGGNRSTSQSSNQRHTAGGSGRQSGLNPVTRSVNNEWRGTQRTSGRGGSGSSAGRSFGQSSRSSSGSGGSGVSGFTNTRNRSGGVNSSGTKSVQPRKRNTRVWNSGGGSTSGRSNSSSRGRSAVSPRRGSGSKATGRSGSTSGRSGSSVNKGGGSRGKSSGSSGSHGGGSSRGGSSGGSRGGGSSGGRSGSGRR